MGEGRPHPEIVHRADALLLDIRNGVRALCRAQGADWDGPEIPKLTDDWQNDVIVSLRQQARDREWAREATEDD